MARDAAMSVAAVAAAMVESTTGCSAQPGAEKRARSRCWQSERWVRSRRALSPPRVGRGPNRASRAASRPVVSSRPPSGPEDDDDDEDDDEDDDDEDDDDDDDEEDEDEDDED